MKHFPILLLLCCGCYIDPGYEYKTECSDANYAELVNYVKADMLSEYYFNSRLEDDGIISIHEYNSLVARVEGSIKSEKYRKIFNESNMAGRRSSD